MARPSLPLRFTEAQPTSGASPLPTSLPAAFRWRKRAGVKIGLFSSGGWGQREQDASGRGNRTLFTQGGWEADTPPGPLQGRRPPAVHYLAEAAFGEGVWKVRVA